MSRFTGTHQTSRTVEPTAIRNLKKRYENRKAERDEHARVRIRWRIFGAVLTGLTGLAALVVLAMIWHGVLGHSIL